MALIVTKRNTGITWFESKAEHLFLWQQSSNIRENISLGMDFLCGIKISTQQRYTARQGMLVAQRKFGGYQPIAELKK